MRSVIFALILALTSAPTAQAGAWLRGKGDGFTSTTLSSTADQTLSTGFYFEYGLAEKLTLGLDISYGVDFTTFEEGSGIAFLRFPLGPTDQTHKFAAHVGVGARYLVGFYLPAAELGLSWGRGIEWGGKYGWVNVDTSYNRSQSPTDPRIKIDGTVGMGLTERSKVMLQMFNTIEGGTTFSRLAPSYLFAPGGGKTTFQLSVEIPVAGGGDPALKLGVWRSF